jgi:Tfp pilus assembly protein PilN
VAAQHGLSHINLLPKDSFEFSGTGKLLKWTTTVGRVLVVMTEFVVILAFASRFYFDKKLNDLSETIAGKLAVVQSYNEVETQMRDLISRQSVVSNYLTNKIDISNKITDLGRQIPLGVAVDSLSMKGKDVSVKGTAGSETAFAQFLLSLKKDPLLKKISLDSTTYDQTSGSVKFSFQMTYK